MIGQALPKELHSSAHQVLFENTLIGEYELHIYRGVQGPVIILEENPHSPLPLEYISEQAVIKFLEACPNTMARFFEHHGVASHEYWIEVFFEGIGCVRRPSSLAVVQTACDTESVTAKSGDSRGAA